MCVWAIIKSCKKQDFVDCMKIFNEKFFYVRIILDLCIVKRKNKMKNQTEHSKAIQELIQTTLNNVENIKKILNKGFLTNDKYCMVCYFPETMLHIASNDNGKFEVRGSLVAEGFTNEVANYIIKNVVNGRSEHPVSATKEQFYIQNLKFEQMMLKSYKSMLINK